MTFPAAHPRRRSTDILGPDGDPFIETYTGVRFRVLSPAPADVRILDIAHALSNVCRFNGHTRVPYSVGEHSVRVSNLIESWGGSKQVQLWGLLHDASEAYVGDQSSPFKRTAAMQGYREVEKNLMAVICERFKLPAEQPAIVRKADLVMLATEARDLMPRVPEHWCGLEEEPLPERIQPLRNAKSAFVRRFFELYERY